MASTLELWLLSRVTYLQNNTPQLIGSTILTGSAASITIAIPAGYNHLQGVFTGRCDASGAQFLLMQFNGDTGTNYTWQRVTSNVSAVSGANAGAAVNNMEVGVVSSATDTANYFGTGTFVVGNVSSSVFKTVTSDFLGVFSVSNATGGSGGGLWASTAAITSVTIFSASGNLVAGSSMSIYGLR